MSLCRLCAVAVAVLLLLLHVKWVAPTQADLQQDLGNGSSYSSSSSSSLSVPVSSQRESRKLTAGVLKAAAAGTINIQDALNLLQDISTLQQSLEPGGAAAARVSAAEQQQQQRQQQGEPSRGILIVAGGTHQLRNAFILVSLLAHPDIHCTLPIEVVYYGAGEFSPAVAAAIQAAATTQSSSAAHAAAAGSHAGMSVRFIDGSSVPPSGSMGLDPHKPSGRWLTGFRAKVHALVWVTSFDQVIMLDSDNTPLADPTPLLDSEAFRLHGNLFWPDFWTNQWMQPALYSLLGLATPWEANPGFRACEAGQVVLNRLRHRDVLEYLWLLNTHSSSGSPGQRQGVVGQCLWGDKDTYPIAFQLAGKGSDFYMVQHPPLQALSRAAAGGSVRLKHAGMVHRAPWAPGPLMWLHRTAAGKFWPHCMMHGGGTCKVWAVTTPVDQQQLLASVADPSAMEMGEQHVDLKWYQQHCLAAAAAAREGGRGAAAAGAGAAAGGDASSHQEAVCGGDAGDSPDGSLQAAGQCAAAAVDQGSPGQQRQQRLGASNATALPCDVDQAAGLLPIPVIRANELPSQVRKLLKAAQQAYAASRAIQEGD